MQVREARRAIDVFRVPRRRGDAPIKRLADLTDDDQIVDGPGLQGAELLVPGRG